MSPDDIPLLFHTAHRVKREELRQFLGELTRCIARGRTIACMIANDDEIRRLNHRYRGQNHATDVLSFPALNRSGLAGDIAISIDRARFQAEEQGHALGDELRILMLHGALHLIGMDHESDAGQMARAECRWRSRFGLPDGLIERSNGDGCARGSKASDAKARGRRVSGRAQAAHPAQREKARSKKPARRLSGDRTPAHKMPAGNRAMR